MKAYLVLMSATAITLTALAIGTYDPEFAVLCRQNFKLFSMFLECVRYFAIGSSLILILSQQRLSKMTLPLGITVSIVAYLATLYIYYNSPLGYGG